MSKIRGFHRAFLVKLRRSGFLFIVVPAAKGGYIKSVYRRLCKEFIEWSESMIDTESEEGTRSLTQKGFIDSVNTEGVLPHAFPHRRFSLGREKFFHNAHNIIDSAEVR